MDSYALQALGESSLSDSESNDGGSNRSTIEDDRLSNQENNDQIDQDLVVEDEATIRAKRKEELCMKYKEGLKLLAFENYHEAESLFESLLNDQIFQDVENDNLQESENKDLIQLKYALLKNLSSISREKTGNYSKALEFIIQAAKIDSSDSCLWFDMGDSAMKLGKYMIARHAFEECFRLNSTYWECLDNLIVLLYSLGSYRLCLKYLLQSLKMDKFYTNGLIIFKKYEEQIRELDYAEIIDDFKDTNYTQCGLDIDLFLSQMPESMYEDLINRIDEIKVKYMQDSRIQINVNFKEENSLMISDQLKNWESIGNFLLKLDETGKFRFDLPLKITMKKEQPTNMDLEKADKNNTETKEAEGASKAPVKRKAKNDISVSNEEGWLKRRSLRKGNDKNDQTITTISDILKKFFEENYLSDNQTETSSPVKKPSNSEMLKTTFDSIKDNEEIAVKPLIEGFVVKETSLFEMIRTYLASLADYSDKKWYGSLEDIYIKMFESFNQKYNMIDALSQCCDSNEFFDYCSIAIVYMELQFSRFKVLKLKKKDQQYSEDEFETERKMSRLISNIYEVEFHLQRYTISDKDDNEEFSSKIENFLLRIWSILLYSSIEFPKEEISSEYFFEKIDDHLENVKNPRGIKVANSMIFPVICKEATKEFRRINRRNKIMQLNDLIGKMFIEEKFDEIIESLEDFADTQKLPFGDDSFKPVIYSHFLESYLNLTSPEFEKFMYFSCKFIRQIIKYLNEESASLNSNQADQKKYEDNIRHLNVVTDFLIEILDLLKRAIEMIEKPNDESSILNRSELVWLMYQLISIYYDHNNDLALKLDLQKKPIGMFKILFDLMVDIDESDRTEYLTLIHDYLARNGFCGANNGELIKWSIDILNGYKAQCEKCNETSPARNKPEQQQEEDTTHSSTPKSCICSEFDELLEQLLHCLFGYKKNKSVRYLKTHSVVKEPYTLNNVILIYSFFKPSRLPEYDDTKNASISNEFKDVLHETLKLIYGKNGDEVENYETSLREIKEAFISALQTENFTDFDQLFDSLSLYSHKNELRFKDIFYLLGDYSLRCEKDSEKLKSMVLNYYIKDLCMNPTRFDSWAQLALFIKEDIIDEYFQINLNLKTESDLDKFLENMNLSINLFRKALEYIRPTDEAFALEYGSFLYQLSAFCSRQLKMSKLIPTYFSSTQVIEPKLSEKRTEYLKMSLDIYKMANEKKKTTEKPLEPETTAKQHPVHDSESSSSVTGDKSQQTSETTRKSKSESRDQQNWSDDWGEEWLHHYMFGKIKEKLSFPLMECLEHYRKSYDYLEKQVSVFLKRISYKSKDCNNLECNEVIYRIYTLTLKRLSSFNTSEENMRALCEFLERLTEVKFIKVHDDFSLAETSKFLISDIFSRSKRISQIPNKDLFLNCVCICVTGLNQILKRFPQHYRSLYRLAHFYSKFLDIRFYSLSKNLLLSTPNWLNLPYMPCAGLFHERNKTNFFNGIWRISSNTKDEQQDFERGGSFSSHLFKSVNLLIDMLARTRDANNLIELSKSFYQKQDPEKKYIKDDVQKDYIANLSLLKSSECLEVVKKAIANLKFKKEFSDENDLIAYQNELIPLLLDAHEAYKLASKHQETLCTSLHNLLLVLFYQFNPMFINNNARVSMEDINKFCLMIEKRDKANKAKPKAKPAPQQPTPQTQPQQQNQTPQVSASTSQIFSSQ